MAKVYEWPATVDPHTLYGLLENLADVVSVCSLGAFRTSETKTSGLIQEKHFIVFLFLFISLL